MPKFEIHSVRLSVPLQERGSSHEGAFPDLETAMAYLRELEHDTDCLIAEVVCISPGSLMDSETVVAQGQRSYSRRGNGGEPTYGPWQIITDDELYVMTRGRDAQVKLLGDS